MKSSFFVSSHFPMGTTPPFFRFLPSEEIDLSAMEKQIMAVWEKSLRDLPDMAELSGLQGVKNGSLMGF